MPATFKLVEPLSKLGIAAPFGVNESGVRIFELLRLLCGTIDLEEKTSGRRVRLRHCFLTESRRRLSRQTVADIIGKAFDGEFQFLEMHRYLLAVQRRNVDFWDSLVGELCLTLASREAGQYTRCFLHLYRIVEMISVALPLFYASSEHNYRRSLEFLKALPTSPNDGDLAIFRKFITEVARQGGYNRYQVKIPYTRGDLRWDGVFERQIEDYVIRPGNLRAVIDDAAKQIEVPFTEFPRFVVSFRNRLFHNALSGENLDLDQLNGPELVCEPLIDPALNWFTLVFCVILKQSVERHLAR